MVSPGTARRLGRCCNPYVVRLGLRVGIRPYPSLPVGTWQRRMVVLAEYSYEYTFFPLAGSSNPLVVRASFLSSPV